MLSLIKAWKDKLYYFFAEKNWGVKREYIPYVESHYEEHKNQHWKHWIILLRLNFHYRVLRRTDYLFKQSENHPENPPEGSFAAPPPENTEILERTRYYLGDESRLKTDELLEELMPYDVISFDIFDTAVFRKVERPVDVFDLMAVEMKHCDFASIRKTAEKKARACKEEKEGTREITLEEIYRKLEEDYGIYPSWAEREIELEIRLTERNPYIFEIYQKLLQAGKTIVFMTDMYLPLRAIEAILQKAGYTEYDEIFLSNEYKERKGDGTLQPELLRRYAGRKIVHMGDTLESDVNKSIEAGLDAIHYFPAVLPFRENNMDNLGGSFYRAIVNHALNSGQWEENLYYEHGFRVGGILAVGFCRFINELAKKKNIDKILFCARDCEIIHKVYNAHYRQRDNEYIQISRYGIMNVTAERYFYDIAGRFILREYNRSMNTKTIESVLRETGYEYLADYLSDADIEPYSFPNSVPAADFERFLLSHKDVVVRHNAASEKAAERYFEQIIGDSKNLLIVDIGWSGTCVEALRYFIQEHFPEKKCTVSGALMCTSRNRTLSTAMTDGFMDAYVYSPFSNMDFTRFIMPGGKNARDTRLQDTRHMPLEYLFTSTQATALGYEIRPDGNAIALHGRIQPANPEEIQSMQAGISAFAARFKANTAEFEAYFSISPYVAFGPLYESMRKERYIYQVYKNFLYDAMTPPFTGEKSVNRFGELLPFQEPPYIAEADAGKRRILFITPELTYTGTPRSMLRMCNVAKALDFIPVVWSAKPGPMIAEYKRCGIEVNIIPETELAKPETARQIAGYDMAVCNTIVTDRYYRLCSKLVPTVWYIREATNIPDFLRNNLEREDTLRHSRDLYCVSEYAAAAIQPYADHPVNVVKNCVEDEREYASDYTCGSRETIRFVQLGTMEYRKGYDVLLEAYLRLPEEYQKQAELYFAGGFINSGTPYCSYLFSRMKNVSGVHYLGNIQDEETKIRTLSEMDVVVVASRDESCSLVALEGSMLSKPLIVTDHVGAKYMVGAGNGIVVRAGDPDDLKNAMMSMIDQRDKLEMMGRSSREHYEKDASMDAYTESMRQLYGLCEQKGTKEFLEKAEAIRKQSLSSATVGKRAGQEAAAGPARREKVIVSLTSHPGRIDGIQLCVESLLCQSVLPEKVLLWLSLEQFPHREEDLPTELVNLTENAVFEIRWVEDDLAPHKKYYYAMQEYPELPVITVDDDVIYDKELIERLMESYRKFPDCVSCMRANLIMFRENGEPRTYKRWKMGYTLLLDTPTEFLLPTGVGGVLYPPHALPPEAFDKEAIRSACLFSDDLWLKVFSSHNGLKTVVPRSWVPYKEIKDSQETALWRLNVAQNNNDTALEKTLEHYDRVYGQRKELLARIRKDRFC